MNMRAALFVVVKVLNFPFFLLPRARSDTTNHTFSVAR